MRKFDIHCHTSNHKMLGLHTDTATIDRIHVLMDTFDLVGVTLLATAFPYKGTGLTNNELLTRLKDDKYKDRKIVFGTIDFSSDWLHSQIESHQSNERVFPDRGREGLFL